MSTQLSRFFTLGEMLFSQTALSKGIDNTPNAEQLENLKETCQQADRVRDLLGHPMFVTSGFRSAKLNAARGGSKTSAHMRGDAMDFVCPGYGTPKEIFAALKKSGLHFDQCILEFPNSASGGWIHIGFGNEMRHQFLVTHDGKNYGVS